jgi:hypothetical protein
LIRRWVQHKDCKVVHGNGIPPTDGDVYFFGSDESESAAVVNGILLIQGKPAVAGIYTFEMVSGDVLTIECNNAGEVNTSGTGYPNSGSSS